MLKDFDIVKEAGPNHTLLREFKGIKADKEFILSVYPANDNVKYPPLLCGLELLVEE